MRSGGKGEGTVGSGQSVCLSVSSLRVSFRHLLAGLAATGAGEKRRSGEVKRSKQVVGGRRRVATSLERRVVGRRAGQKA